MALEEKLRCSLESRYGLKELESFKTIWDLGFKLYVFQT